MFEKFSQDKFACGLDIGGHTLKACLLQAKEDNKYQLLGAYQNKSFGFKNGSVSDLNDFADCIYQSVHQLSTKTGCKIKDVIVGIDGSLVDVRKTDTVIPLVERGSKVISEKDIKKINHQARILSMKMEEETLHDLPQSYEVDDVNSVLNPVGLYGRKLGIHTLTAVANINRMRNISKAVNQAGYDVERFCFSSYLSGSVALKEDETVNGCILMELGSHKTNLFLYYEGVLRLFERFEFGGDDLTYAISEKLSLPYELAEEIKLTYGDITHNDFNPDEEILVKKESAYLPVNRKAIYEAIYPVVIKFLDKVKQRLNQDSNYPHVHNGFVLCGGTSLLTGMPEIVEEKFNKPARLAGSDIFAAKHNRHSVMFLPAVALAKESLERKSNTPKRSTKDEGLIAGWLDRFREIYQEYF